MGRIYVGDEVVVDPATKAPRTALWLPGASGNYASCPNPGTLPTGDIDIRTVQSRADWTPVAALTTLVAQWASANIRFALFAENNPRLRFQWSTNGTATSNVSSTANLPVGDGDTIGCRATMNATTGDVTFYTSSDLGVTWDQLGAVVAGAGPVTLYASTAALEVGSILAGTTYLANGTVHSASVRSSIGGTVVASFDATAPMGPRQRDAQGNIWTINGSAYAWQYT
jgi:hypothetical protein